LRIESEELRVKNEEFGVEKWGGNEW